MKCVICKTGETHAGRTTINLTRADTLVVIKNVPADICDNCGEYYLSEEMTGQVLKLAADANLKGAEIEILRWAA